MITRDVASLRTVVAFNQPYTTATATGDQAEGPGTTAGGFLHAPTVFAGSCGGMDGDSTANAIPGQIIDRLGLGRGYNSVGVSAFGSMDIGTSTINAMFGAVYAWLYHSSTTCADDFDRFSTEHENARGIAYVLNATSTLASGYMATSTSVGTFGTHTATATGAAKAEYDAHYPLAGAGRYLRPYLFVETQQTAASSGSSQWPHVGVNLIFGDPDEAPRSTTSTAAVYKTAT